MTEAIATRMIKGVGRTTFIDLRRAKNDLLYVTISVLGRNSSGDSERQLITLFGEHATAVAAALNDILVGQDMSQTQVKNKKVNAK